MTSGSYAGANIGGATMSWSYDNFGNRSAQSAANIAALTSSWAHYTVDGTVNTAFNGKNRLTGAPNGLLSYDLSGDVLFDGTHDYLYDAEGRFSTPRTKTCPRGPRLCASAPASAPGNPQLPGTGYIYDAFGNRVAKTVNEVTTKYLVEDDVNPTGLPQVVEELVNGAVTRQYTYGLQRISENQEIANVWTSSFYEYDGGGSVRQLTNSAGAVTDEYEYDAFGNSFTKVGTTPNNYLYRGEQYDADLGLYYLRARYYNPATGRFLSRDPEDGATFVPKTLLKYLYVGGDPVNMVDPSGRDLAGYGILLARSVKAAVVFNAIGCGTSIGFSLLDGTLMELFKEDPTSAAATAFGCLTVAVSGVPGTAAGTAVTVTLNSLALASCGWGLYQAVNAENQYFADLDSGNYTAAEVDYQKALHGIFGAFTGCELTLAAMLF